MRNAAYDAVALHLVNRSVDRRLTLASQLRDPKGFEAAIKREVVRAHGTVIIAAALQHTPDITNSALGEILRTGLKQDWKPTSALRYANGIKRYYEWTLGV
jgi:hypothetical protein